MAPNGSSKTDLQAVPAPLLAAGRLVMRQGTDGNVQPTAIIYQARIALDQHDQSVAPGHCRITVDPWPLGLQIIADSEPHFYVESAPRYPELTDRIFRSSA